MAKRVLSRMEVIKGNELLKLHLVPSDRDGFWKYQNGWDDAKIAQEIEPTIQASHIMNLRSELFGKLETSKALAAEDNGKIKEIETIVHNLLTCYGQLEIKHNTLIDTLALNRVVPTNIQHLKTTCKEEKK